MKILTLTAVTLAALAACVPAQAADLNLDRPSHSSRAVTRTYVVSPYAIWNPNRPLDLIYTYAPEYRGWRGDPTYASCNTVRVRETLPDGTIVVRRRTVC